MRKYLNWYSLAVIIILIPGSIFLFITRNENSEGAIFLLPILNASCIGLWLTLTLIRIVTRPSNPIAIKYVLRSISLLLIVGVLLMFVFQNSWGKVIFFIIFFAFLFLIFILLTTIRVISSIKNTSKDNNKHHDAATSQSDTEDDNHKSNLKTN